MCVYPRLSRCEHACALPYTRIHLCARGHVCVIRIVYARIRATLLTKKGAACPLVHQGSGPDWSLFSYSRSRTLADEIMPKLSGQSVFLTCLCMGIHIVHACQLSCTCEKISRIFCRIIYSQGFDNSEGGDRILRVKQRCRHGVRSRVGRQRLTVGESLGHMREILTISAAGGIDGALTKPISSTTFLAVSAHPLLSCATIVSLTLQSTQ